MEYQSATLTCLYTFAFKNFVRKASTFVTIDFIVSILQNTIKLSTTAPIIKKLKIKKSK